MTIGGDPAKCNRTQPKLLMPGDWVWNVGFFERLDLLRGQFEAECGDRVFKMLRFRSANNRGGHRRFMEQPGQSDPGRRNTTSCSKVLDAGYDPFVGFGRPSI